MIDDTELADEYDGPQDIGADGWVDSRKRDIPTVEKKQAPPKNKKTAHLKTVPTKLRGKKVHGTVTLVLWDQYAGRAEVTAEFPVEYRNGPAILTLVNFMYPSSPDDVGINRYLHDFFAKVFGVDFSDIEKLKNISSIADLENRTMEIDAVLDVSSHGRSYYRIVSWKFIGGNGECPEKPAEPGKAPPETKPGEMELLMAENRDLRLKVAKLEKKVAYWKGEADKYWDKVKELLSLVPDSPGPVPPVAKNAPKRAIGKPVEAGGLQAELESIGNYV